MLDPTLSLQTATMRSSCPASSISVSAKARRQSNSRRRRLGSGVHQASSFEREFDLLRRRHLVMPLDAVLDERDPLALDRVGDDATRPAVARRDEALIERGMVMAVALDALPAEGAPFVGERFEPVGVLGAGALLQAIAVDDRDKIVEAAMASAHRRLPVRAFLQFAVAEHDERAPVRPAPAWRRSRRRRRSAGRDPSGPVLASTPGILRRLGGRSEPTAAA